MDTSKCDVCDARWTTGTVIYTAKCRLARGWRGYFCITHLVEWIAQTPAIQRNDTVTITN